MLIRVAIEFIVILAVLYAIMEPQFQRSMASGLMRRLIDPPVNPKTGWRNQYAMHPSHRYIPMVILAICLTVILENPAALKTVLTLWVLVQILGAFIVFAHGFSLNGNICPKCQAWHPYNINHSKCRGCHYEPLAVKAEAEPCAS